MKPLIRLGIKEYSEDYQLRNVSFWQGQAYGVYEVLLESRSLLLA